MGLYLGGLVIGRIFAPEIWGPIFGGGGGVCVCVGGGGGLFLSWLIMGAVMVMTIFS